MGGGKREGKERVARVTNDPVLSPESGSVTVITGTKSSLDTFICKNEEKEEMCGLFAFYFIC